MSRLSLLQLCRRQMANRDIRIGLVAILAVVLLATITYGVVTTYKDRQITEIRSRYELLLPTQEKLDTVVKKQTVINQKQQILLDLTEQRTSAYAALVKINAKTPASIKVTDIIGEGGRYIIIGQADSSANLAEYRHIIEADGYFQQVEVVSAGTTGALPVTRFQLAANVRPVKN